MLARGSERSLLISSCHLVTLSPVHFTPASHFSLDVLADLYTRTFADYSYPVLITPEMLAEFIRVEDLALQRSPVMCVGDELVGFATVGMRGDQGYCRGFGVTVPYRGQGLASALCEEMLEQARQAGARRLTLGVLIKNERAVKTYLRSGLRVVRQLFTYEWERTNENATEVAEADITPADPSALLQHFAALHPVPAIWNRDLPSLVHELTDENSPLPVGEGFGVRVGAQEVRGGLAILENDAPAAYVLFSERADRIEILDLAATRVDDGKRLLRALQRIYPRLVCWNEPEDSPMRAAFLACGFVVKQPRYEMDIEFTRIAVPE